MDLWIVVAAASGVYLLKQWQSLLRQGRSSVESFRGTSDVEKPNSPSLWQLLDKSFPFSSLAQRKMLDEHVSKEKEKMSRGEVSEMALAAEMTCSREADGGKWITLENQQDCNVLYISNLATGFSRNDNLQVKDEIQLNDGINTPGDFVPEHSTRCMVSLLGLPRKRSSLRTKRLRQHFGKPLNSLESCLLAQLYNEHAEVDEYLPSSLQSPPAPTVRPMFISHGSRTVTRASGNSSGVQFGTGNDKLNREAYLEGNETTTGVPPLTKLRSLGISRKIKIKAGRGQRERLSSSSKTINRKHFHSLGGSQDGVFLFCLGISIGMVFSQISNKREVDKMKDLLQQTENLVQDLEEELEMKDSITVKELAKEDYESQDTYDHVFGIDAYKDFESQDAQCHAFRYGRSNRFSFEPDDQKAEGNSELMSKIEAELEAEIERLEVTMNSSNLENRLSNLVELDQDFVADVVQGELRVEMVSNQTGGDDDSNRDASSISKTHSANYAVSPRELSLRLYEVIQSRLEERIKELEIELQKSERNERNGQTMESECFTYCRELSNREAEPSTQQTLIAVAIEEPTVRPLVVNSPGEGRHVEDEAEDELKPESRSGDYRHDFDGIVSWQCEEEEEEEEKFSSGFYGDNLEQLYQNGNKEEMMQKELSNADTSGDENEDGDDEMKLLIKQIVEKTREGSPIVLNAQRAFFSIYEDEH